MDFGKHAVILIAVSILVSMTLTYPLLLGGFDETRWMGGKLYIDVASARRFLESQYVASIGLLRAAATVYPENMSVYIANDNVLAARALAVLGSPLASRVMAVSNNKYSGGWNGKIDILLGRDIPDKFYSSYNELVGEVNGYRILYEKMNKSMTIRDWYDYADLLVYRALDKLLHGLRREAELLFLNLTRMWDGYGFRDIVFNKTGVYAVYKCALFIYLYRALEYAGSTIIHGYKYIYDKCLEIISKAQDPIYGGIHTDYKVENGKIIIQGDMNTETTSMVVLALYSRYPELIGEKCRQTGLGGERHSGLVVGVYFYPWYSISMHRHWDNTVIDKPLIGYYDSYNDTVIKWQLRLIRDAGIDLIVFSWWGPHSFEDNTTKTIVKYLRDYGLKFAIMVEPYINYTDPRPYNEEFWEKTIRCLVDNYIEPYGDVYFRLNGKPLILAFNPIGKAFDPRKVFKDYCIRIVGNDVDHGGCRDWDLWPDYDINLTGRLRIRRDGYVALSPRFDGEHFRPGGIGPYDPFLEEKWYLRQWRFVLSHLDEIRIVMIYSWNAYRERPMIEPFIDAGANIDL